MKQKSSNIMLISQGIIIKRSIIQRNIVSNEQQQQRGGGWQGAEAILIQTFICATRTRVRAHTRYPRVNDQGGKWQGQGRILIGGLGLFWIRTLRIPTQ